MPPALSPKIGVQQVKETRDMISGFLEAILEGSFQGKHSTYIGMGVQFLRNMLVQSNADLDRLKAREKEMLKRYAEEDKVNNTKP